MTVYQTIQARNLRIEAVDIIHDAFLAIKEKAAIARNLGSNALADQLEDSLASLLGQIAAVAKADLT